MLTEAIGLYIMGTYSDTNVRVWHYLSNWNGIRGKSMTAFVSQQCRPEQKGAADC